MGYEEVLRRVGSDGIFQRCFAFFGAFACVVPMMQNMAVVFTLETNPFDCVYEDNETIGKTITKTKKLRLNNKTSQFETYK